MHLLTEPSPRFSLSLSLSDKVSPCMLWVAWSALSRPGWPRTHGESLASASLGVGLKACADTLGLIEVISSYVTQPGSCESQLHLLFPNTVEHMANTLVTLFIHSLIHSSCSKYLWNTSNMKSLSSSVGPASEQTQQRPSLITLAPSFLSSLPIFSLCSDVFRRCLLSFSTPIHTELTVFLAFFSAGSYTVVQAGLGVTM